MPLVRFMLTANLLLAKNLANELVKNSKAHQNKGSLKVCGCLGLTTYTLDHPGYTHGYPLTLKRSKSIHKEVKNCVLCKNNAKSSGSCNKIGR